MIAAFVFVAAYFAVAELGSKVMPPPPKPPLAQSLQQAPAEGVPPQVVSSKD